MIVRVLRGVRRRLLGGPPAGDYRAYLFEELVAYLGGRRPARLLEIGPKDGLDTRRLLELEPERLTLLDLPRLEASNRAWLSRIESPRIEYVSANVMYSTVVNRLEPFDVVRNAANKDFQGLVSSVVLEGEGQLREGGNRIDLLLQLHDQSLRLLLGGVFFRNVEFEREDLLADVADDWFHALRLALFDLEHRSD